MKNGYRFRNAKQIDQIIDQAVSLLQLIDTTDYNMSIIDTHEAETLLCISSLRSEALRLVSVGREIRRADR